MSSSDTLRAAANSIRRHCCRLGLRASLSVPGLDSCNQAQHFVNQPTSFTREQFVRVRAMLGQQAEGIAPIAKETVLTRQTVYRIKDDPAGAEAALAVWGL